ncbi:CdaR family protein [Peptostreptococcus sp. D1]|uniref:CdaR family protein n=1 Tax=Peptostreptococcus sp. D1 TaxID=72304 RepID=UPI0008EB589F|nr:hypothetical protein [Peptostreptococcus sp. D1]SFE81377.1 YbbR domain-containing protein [Peptostreptococcus sp. D1]
MKKNILSKNNLRTKIISVLAAIILWMYVIAVVDPEDKKVIENIPITITNSSDLERQGFVIYPVEDLKTDITVEGKLSEIQKLNKNNVDIYADIVNPVEGKNIITLRTNISNRVSRELKDASFAINLEKAVTKKVAVKIEVPLSEQNEISEAVPEENEVEIIGPSELVNSVSYVGGIIPKEKLSDKATSTVNFALVAYTSSGAPVNVKISNKKIKVKIMRIMSKEVPVRLRYTGDKDLLPNLSTNPDKVVILGNNETLKNIDEIVTEEIKDDIIDNNESKLIKLSVPNNIKIKGDISQVELIKNE